MTSSCSPLPCVTFVGADGLAAHHLPRFVPARHPAIHAHTCPYIKEDDPEAGDAKASMNRWLGPAAIKLVVRF